jgi:hypothetical protein
LSISHGFEVFSKKYRQRPHPKRVRNNIKENTKSFKNLRKNGPLPLDEKGTCVYT